MKKIMLVMFATFLVALTACKSSLIVQDNTVTDVEKYQNLVSYYLPKTLLKIKVPIEKNALKEGLIATEPLTPEDKKLLKEILFSQYGWEPVKQEDAFSIGEKIQFIPVTVPDEQKHFTIAYDRAKALSHTSGISLSKDGIITSGEFAQDDKTYEYVTKGVELLASAAGAVMGLSKSAVAPAKVSVNNHRIQVLLAELNSLTDVKAALITSPTNGVASIEPVKFRLDYIDKRILQIKNELLGWNKKTTYNLTFIYEPGSKLGDYTILKIDAKKGVVIPNLDTSKSQIGANAPFSAKETKGDEYKELKISVKNAYTVSAAVKPFTNTKGYGRHFLVYNVPAKFSIQLSFDNEPLKSFATPDDEKGTDVYEIYFPQKGTMAALPYDFKDMKVLFFEDIGSIKEIKYSKNASLDSSSVIKGFAAIDSIISLRNKIKESKKPKPVDDSEEVKEQVIRLIIQNTIAP